MNKRNRVWITRAMLRTCRHPVVARVEALNGAVMVLDNDGLRRDQVEVIIDADELQRVLVTHRHPMAELNRRVDAHVNGPR